MDKTELTKQLIAQANLHVTFKEAYGSWWWPNNSLNKEHKRLTSAGCNALAKLIKPYHFEFNFSNTPAQLKRLSKLEIPYYVDYKGITIFSPKAVSMVRLYGSFDRYLDLIQNR